MVFVTLSLTIDSSIVLTQDNKKRTLKQPLRNIASVSAAPCAVQRHPPMNIVGVSTAPWAVQAHAHSVAWWNMYCFTKQKVWFYRFCPLAVLNPWPFVSRTNHQMNALVLAALGKLYLNLISPDGFCIDITPIVYQNHAGAAQDRTMTRAKLVGGFYVLHNEPIPNL